MSDYFLPSVTEHWATVPQKHSFILGRLTGYKCLQQPLPSTKKGSFPSQRRTIAKIIYVCKHRGSESSYRYITSFTQHANDGVPTKGYHFYVFTLVFNISYDFPPVEQPLTAIRMQLIEAQIMPLLNQSSHLAWHNGPVSHRVCNLMYLSNYSL